MIDSLCLQRVNDADVVGDPPDVFEQVAKVLPRFPELLEVMLRAKTLQVSTALQLRDRLSFRERFWNRLPVHLAQLGFVIQSFQM